MQMHEKGEDNGWGKLEKGESDTKKSFLVAVVWVAAGVGVGVVGGGGGGSTAVGSCNNGQM